MSTIRAYLNFSDAPALLRRIPRLLWLFHKINYVLVPRNWYVRRMLRRLRTSAFQPKSIIDAGCGLGDHSFMAARMFGTASVTGIDSSRSNIDICILHAAAIKSGRHAFLCADLNHSAAPTPASLILCITVLQYITDDLGALRMLHSLLTPDGKMILYVPVRFKRYLSWYKRLSQLPAFNYDSDLGRVHTYTVEEILKKMRTAGFLLERVEHTYGPAGAVAYEIFSIAQYYLTHGSSSQQLLSAIAFIIYLPFFLLLEKIDSSQQHDSGNGVILLLKKM